MLNTQIRDAICDFISSLEIFDYTRHTEFNEDVFVFDGRARISITWEDDHIWVNNIKCSIYNNEIIEALSVIIALLIKEEMEYEASNMISIANTMWPLNNDLKLRYNHNNENFGKFINRMISISNNIAKLADALCIISENGTSIETLSSRTS